MRSILVFLLLACAQLLPAQKADISQYIREHAVRFDRPDSLPQDMYGLLGSYPLVMMGEMHGTNEPALFVKGLANLLVEMGDSVQVGLEIPEDKMAAFLQEKTDSSIYHSWFFAEGYPDGRSSKAWADVIRTIHHLSGAEVFFFDVTEAESRLSDNRDSFMYVHIRQRMLAHPHWKTVTLCGNYHNRTNAKEANGTLGYYLLQDELLGAKGRVFSINHYYRKGTMCNNIGHGLTVREVDNGASVYDSVFDQGSYLVPVSPTSTYPYQGLLYTWLVTDAKMVKGE